MSTKKHEVPEELLSGLLANYKKPEDLIGENGLLKQLTKLLVEKALDAEMTVRDIEVAMPATPFSLCTEAMPNFRALIGARVGGGWRQAIRDRVPVSQGCTHVREMLSVMATVAFQTIASLSLRQSGLKLPPTQPRPQRPHFIDGCYAWDSGRAVVAFLYPDQVRES